MVIGNDFDSTNSDSKSQLHAIEVVPSSLSIHREPSFSGWCSSNNNDLESQNHDAKLRRPEEDIEAERGGEDFELVLGDRDHNNNKKKKKKVLERGSRMDGNDDAEGKGRRVEYSAFEVQSGTEKDRRLKVDVENGEVFGVEKESGGGGGDVSAANVVKTICFVLVWYIFSLFLTLYNKSLLGDKLGKFPAPLLMNTFHFAMQAILSRAITWFWSERFRSGVEISWRDYFSKVVPTALATALDINLSNESLVFITVTFATMCKSASPIYLLLFAFAFRLESPSVKLFGIILIISFGILLTVAKETEFEFWGFIFVMLAAVMSGFRWCMMQILLQRETYGLKNPLTFMSTVTPVMAVATALFSLLMDPWRDFATNDYFNSTWNIFRSCLLMLFGGTLAFFMVLTEYVLVSVTSAVTVTIAGVVKEAVTIIVAIFYFHDEFTWMKGIGLFIIIIGVSFFNWFKYEKLKKGDSSESGDGPAGTNISARYVILEEADDLVDSI